ncbi:DUF4097 family beta strand repeat-containing protein [Clostridium sp.]|uniref:DUF4097 family beta strand repeat-containing protein n=1 Tax=Clostridium sp. TaxID=1506 RepID=UPI003217FD52
MKKKLLTIIPCVLLSTTLLVGCNVKFGVGSRRDMNNNIGSNVSDIINSNNNNNNNNANTDLYEENLNNSIPMEGIESVNINIYASTVTVQSIEGTDFTLSCTGSSSMVKNTSFEKKGGTLNIEENGISSSFNLNSFNSSYNRKVVIGIPKDFKDDITLGSGAGNITINSIISNNLEIKGGAGDLTIKDVIFKDLKLEQGVGTTDISLKYKCGNMNITGGVGELDISLAEVGGNLTYSGGIGEATIDIPDNSPVKISTESGLGSVNVNVRTSGEDTYLFDLSIGIGSLDIN